MNHSTREMEGNTSIIPAYLELLDRQRETAFIALEGLVEEDIWQRPQKGEWSIGEILNHNYLVMNSTMLYVRFAWRVFYWYGKLFRSKSYQRDIPDLFRAQNFPMWIGFLWTPRHNSRKRVSLGKLKEDLRDLHRIIRSFYEDKDEDILGNIAVFDPYFGWLNLIVSLRLGCHHDQLHYEDVLKLSAALKAARQQYP